MDPLIQKTLEKIKSENIRPQPSWQLSLMNNVFWGLFLLMVLLAAVSFSMTFHLTSHIEWDIYEYIKKSRVEILFSMLPLFWIFLLVIFFIISYINVRHTKHGYRYHPYKLLGTIVGISLGTGAIICVTEATDVINDTLAHNMNRFPYVMVSKEQLWNQPHMGLLSGEILLVQPEQIDLRDFHGKQWLVLTDDNTVLRSAVIIQEKEKIRVIGRKEDEVRFRAQQIRPWECPLPGCQAGTDTPWVRVINAK